jgi:prepilin-type N-terminal cleavage/methylation domain-containing protein
MKKEPAFTLIELLIVVAIIAILAAIAVPNFLEAQTRAKVSRCKADIRTVAVGFESYAVDHAKYPPLGTPLGYEGWNGWWLDQCYYITTPISYIASTKAVIDVFPKPRGWREVDIYQTNSYIHYDLTTLSPIYAERGLKYLLMSFGPTAALALDNSVFGFIPYDPTNGTVSLGQIMCYGPGNQTYFRAY